MQRKRNPFLNWYAGGVSLLLLAMIFVKPELKTDLAQVLTDIAKLLFTY